MLFFKSICQHLRIIIIYHQFQFDVSKGMGAENSTEFNLSCCLDGQVSNIQNCSKILSMNEMLSAKQRSKIQSSGMTKASSSESRELFLLDVSVSSCKVSSKYSYDLPYIKTANQCYERENYQDAINGYMMALQKVDRRDLRLADIHFTIAQCYFKMQNFNTALKHCKLAEVKYTELVGKNSQGVAMACNLIGHIQTQVSDFLLAQHYYQKAYRIYRQETVQNYQNLLQTGFNLAALYLNMDQDQKSLQIYLEIEALIEKDQDFSHNSTTLELYRCLGVVSFKLNSLQKSIYYFYKSFHLALSLSQIKNCEAQKLVNSFKLLKDFIKKMPSGKQSPLVSKTIKMFFQLNHYLQ